VVAPRPTRLTARTAAVLTGALALGLVVSPGTGNAAPRLDLDQAERQVNALYHQAEQATERYDVARMAMRDAERGLAQAQRKAAAQQTKVSALQRTVGAFAADAYRNEGIDRTLQLVFSDDPSAFIDRAASLDALSSRQADALRKVVEARRELKAAQVAAAQQLAVLEAQRKALATEKNNIQQALRAARAVLARLQASDRAKFNRASRDGDPRDLLKGLPLPTNDQAGRAVKFALAQLGDRYVWSGDGPDTWDCSGLTMAAWRAAGVSLPHSSAEQYAQGHKISRADLQPGDLVFFYSPISHVGLDLGNGRMVHAPNPSRRVEISSIDSMPYAGAVRP
jgi:cell wall-associated NlpC family hydrolase